MSPTIPRELTLDERKAANAAFEGRPFDPRWSQAAKRVYDGLVLALYTRHMEPSLPIKDADPAPSQSPRSLGLRHEADEQAIASHTIAGEFDTL